MTVINELRDDGPYENVFLNVGTSKDRGAFTRAVTPALLDMLQLENLYEGDGFARRIIDLPAEEMVRAGYCLEGVDDESEVVAGLENIGAMEKLCDALRWSSLYGGSLVVMLIDDGGTLEDQLNLDRVRSIEQLRVYDRWEVSRQKKYDDPMDKRFGSTQMYLVSPPNGFTYLVHESRCLVFDGVPIPDRPRERNDGWGASRLQQCYDQLIRFGMGHYWANQLLERAQQAIHGIPDLTSLLRSPGGEALVKKRIDIVDMTRSINNTVVIDASESYDLKATSLAGVSDIVDRFGLALSAVSGVPESLLFGRKQGGINNSGANDLENWYAKIAQAQTTILLPQLDRLVAIQLYAMGRYVENYLIKFKPLYLPSEKDVAETDYKTAQTRQIYNAMGALDASEVRSMLDDEGYPIDDMELDPESGDLTEEETPSFPEEKTDELRLAQIDLIKAQAENLRRPAVEKADRVDNHPQSIDVNIGGIRLDMPEGAINVNNVIPDVKAPDIRVDVHVPESPAPNVTVNPTAVVKMDAPDVVVNNNVQPAPVTIQTPMKKTTTVITRDASGEMTGSISTEQPKD